MSCSGCVYHCYDEWDFIDDSGEEITGWECWCQEGHSDEHQVSCHNENFGELANCPFYKG